MVYFQGGLTLPELPANRRVPADVVLKAFSAAAAILQRESQIAESSDAYLAGSLLHADCVALLESATRFQRPCVQLSVLRRPEPWNMYLDCRHEPQDLEPMTPVGAGLLSRNDIVLLNGLHDRPDCCGCANGSVSPANGCVKPNIRVQRRPFKLKARRAGSPVGIVNDE